MDYTGSFFDTILKNNAKCGILFISEFWLMWIFHNDIDKIIILYKYSPNLLWKKDLLQCESMFAQTICWKESLACPLTSLNTPPTSDSRIWGKSDFVEQIPQNRS